MNLLLELLYLSPKGPGKSCFYFHLSLGIKKKTSSLLFSVTPLVIHVCIVQSLGIE